jgi:peptide-methionine (S)-S-oxide reductase
MVKKLVFNMSSFLIILSFGNCEDNNSYYNNKKNNMEAKKNVINEDLTKYSIATFAAGCFWCEEAVFESVKGVKETISGYSGGTEKNPTYEEVSSGTTGHAESVEVYYDSIIVSYTVLLKVFFHHNFCKI